MSLGSRSWVAPLRRFAAAVSLPLLSILIALFIGALVIMIDEGRPLEAYTALFRGAFGTGAAMQRTMEKATPLVFSGLAVAFAFKGGLFNIGAQGQLLFGAVTAGIVGYRLTGLPALVHVPLAVLAGAAAGGLYGAIPGALKRYRGAHEVITTIMLNYIAINITDYLATGPFRDTTPGNIVARTPLIENSARIPVVGGVPLGFVLALVAGLLVWWLLARTTIGFEISTVGRSPHAAHYAGIRVTAIVILTMALSGALAGIGGAVETLGIIGRYQPGFNVGLGFDGITVALLGKTHPVGVIFSALLVGAMRAGAPQMQFSVGVRPDIIDMVLAIILFFIAADLVRRWLVKRRGERVVEGEEILLSSGWGQQA
jgi:general nucleoside transport system permease protein